MIHFKTCIVVNCGKPHHAKSYCHTHYKKFVTTYSIDNRNERTRLRAKLRERDEEITQLKLNAAAWALRMEDEMLDIEKLRELAQKATPGPWYANHAFAVMPHVSKPRGAFSAIGTKAEPSIFVSTHDDIAHGLDYRECISVPDTKGDNAKFIAAACPDVILELLDRLEAAEAKR